MTEVFGAVIRSAQGELSSSSMGCLFYAVACVLVVRRASGFACNTTAQCREKSPVSYNGGTECWEEKCYCTEPLFGPRCEYHLQHEYPLAFNSLYRGFTVIHVLVGIACLGALVEQYAYVVAGKHRAGNVANVVTVSVLAASAFRTVYAGAAHGFEARGYWRVGWRGLYLAWGCAPACTLFGLCVLCQFWHFALVSNRKIQHAELPGWRYVALAFCAQFAPAAYLSLGLEFGPDPYARWLWVNAAFHTCTALLLLGVAFRLQKIGSALKGALRKVAEMTRHLVAILGFKCVHAFVYTYRTRELTRARAPEYLAIELVDMVLSTILDGYLLVLAMRLSASKRVLPRHVPSSPRLAALRSNISARWRSATSLRARDAESDGDERLCRLCRGRRADVVDVDGGSDGVDAVAVELPVAAAADGDDDDHHGRHEEDHDHASELRRPPGRAKSVTFCFDSEDAVLVPGRDPTPRPPGSKRPSTFVRLANAIRRTSAPPPRTGCYSEPQEDPGKRRSL